MGRGRDASDVEPHGNIQHRGAGSRYLRAAGSDTQRRLGSFSLGYAAVYLGIAEAAYGYYTDYVSEKTWTPEGGAIINHPGTQKAIGEMSVAIQSGRLLLVDAALTDDPQILPARRWRSTGPSSIAPK